MGFNRLDKESKAKLKTLPRGLLMSLFGHVVPCDGGWGEGVSLLLFQKHVLTANSRQRPAGCPDPRGCA